jgi:hypothetical protein
MGQMVVGHAIAGTKTPSPEYRCGLDLLGLSKASIIARFADEPEFIIMKKSLFR